MHPLTRRAAGEDGAISVMAAVMMLAILMSTALAVDVGRVAYVSRDQQGVTDRAALDAVPVLDEVPVGTPLATVQAMAEAAVGEALARNPGSTGTADARQVVLVELGNVGGDRRFTVPACATPCTVEDVSAVRVQTTSVVPYVFAIGATDDDDPGLAARRVTKSAVAEQTEAASVTIGSRLASLDDGLVDATLEAMVCQHVGDLDDGACDVDVDVLTYEGLAGVDVRLGDLVDELGVGAGSVEDILTSRVTVVDLLSATADVLGRDGRVAEAALLDSVAAELDGTVDLALGDLLDVTTTNGQAVADAGVNVLGLLTGSLQVANGTNLVALPGLTAAVPGMVSSSADLTVVQGPVTSAIGPARLEADGSWATSARTAQVDLGVEAVVEASTLSGLVGSIAGLVPLLSLGAPTLSDVTVPLEVQVADGQVDLTDVVCDPGGPGSDPDVGTQVTTGVAQVVVPDDVLTTVTIPVQVSVLGLGLVDAGELEIEVRGGATPVDLGASVPQDVDFLSGTYPRGPERVTGTGVGLGGLTSTQLDLDVTVQHVHDGSVLGAAVAIVAGVLTPAVQLAIAGVVETSVQAAVFPVLDVVNTTLLDPALQVLGLEVGAADVWANSADCERRALAAIVD